MPPESRVAFGPFVLDVAERRLLRDGRPVALAPQPFRVLAVLVARAGYLVTKDALVEAAWGGAVVEDNALAVAVSKLRAALGPDGAAFVETVPRAGYRFVGPVVPAEPAAQRAPPHLPEPHPPEQDVSTASPLPGGERDRVRGRSALAALAGLATALAAALALAAAWALGPRASAPPPPQAAALADTDLPAGDAAAARAEAVAAVARGRALWASRRAWDAAYEEFRTAVGRDPSYAPGHVGLADTYALQYAAADEAEAALARALALEPDLADAHATRGFVRAFQRWDWAGADAAFSRALALEPANAKALQWLAAVRMVQRRPAEAERLLGRALAAAPASASLWSDLCEVRLTARRLAAAEAACERALGLDPAFPFARQHLFWTAWHAGRPADALRDAARSRPPDAPPRPPPAALAADGGRAYLRWWLAAEAAGEVPGTAYGRAQHLALLGETDRALAALAEAVDRRLFPAPFAHADPAFDGLRADPRFGALMARMGLGG